MQQPHGVGRRRLVTSAIAGGALGVGGSGVAQAKAATSSTVTAKKLQPGDVIVGPGATVVRVASVDKLPTGRRRVRYTDPYTGAATPMSADLDQTGFPARFRFVVLGRGASVASVQLTRPADPVAGPTTVAEGPTVIDGGAP